MTTATKKKINALLKGYSFIGLNLIGILIFWTIPLIFSVVISFAKWDFAAGLKTIRFVGLENYIEMWKDEWFLISLKNNFIFTGVFVPLLIVISFFIAVIIKEYVIGEKIVKMGLYLPYIVNVVATAAVWMALFSKFGPIIAFAEWLGIENMPVLIGSTTWALPSIILISVWSSLGYTALLFLAGLVNIPEELYESAQIDGANGWKRLVLITIPMLSPTTFFVVVTTIIHSFRVFGLINVMTGGGPGSSTTMMVFNIYRTGFRFGQMGFAAAQGIVLLSIILIITLIQFAYQRRNESYM